MSAGSLTVTITIPSVNGAGGQGNAAPSNSIACDLLNKVAQAVGSTNATSGSVNYPPGSSTVAATWTYTPAT